jgi:hypothetical protein
LQDEVYRAMWELAVDEAIDKLVSTTAVSNLTFVGSWQYGMLNTRLEHLACFFPGELEATLDLPRGHETALQL